MLVQTAACVNVLCNFLLQWLKLTSDDVKEQIYKLAKKGLTPSQIGYEFLKALFAFCKNFVVCVWSLMLMCICVLQKHPRNQYFSA